MPLRKWPRVPEVQPEYRGRTSTVILFIIAILLHVSFGPLLIEGRQSGHRSCPGCPQQHHHSASFSASTSSSSSSTSGSASTSSLYPGVKDAPSPDDLRLEAIKHQILTKLGLRSRPDVNRTLASVPRYLALETLYRAEAQPPLPRSSSGRNRSPHQDEDYSPTERTTTQGPTSTPYYTYQRASSSSYSSSSSSSQDFQEAQDDVDDFYARTSEIITFAEPGRTLNGQPLLEFPMSSGEPALEPLRIKRATLWARVELRHSHHYQHHRAGQNNQRNITLWVFRVRCGNTTHLRGKELGHHLEMATSLAVNVAQLGWQKFDVTRVVSGWYTATSNSPKDKLTLLVDCTGCGMHVHVSTFEGQAPHVIDASTNKRVTEDPDRPFLVVRTDPAAVKRVRRRAVECSGAIKGQCCKQRFYVSFSQLGWDDWIIAPQGYYANYCRGDCAAGHRTPDTFLNYYTHVIEEYRKMDRLAGMQPCCAPLKFSSMSLIYYGPDSNIIKRDLPKMVVDECGCP